MIADAQRSEVSPQADPQAASRLRASIERNDAGSRLALEPGRFMPRFVAVSPDGRALVWIRHHSTLAGNQPAPAALHIVDLRTGEIARNLEPLPELQRIVAVDERLEHLIAIVKRGRQSAILSCEIASHALRETHVFEGLLWAGEAFEAQESLGRWVTVDLDPTATVPRLTVLDPRTGARVSSYPLRNDRNDYDWLSFSVASSTSMAAVGHAGGLIEVVDYMTGQRREFKPHRRVGSEDRVRVMLSANGRFLASTTRSEMVLTDVSTGTSSRRSLSIPPQPRSITCGGWEARLDVAAGLAFVGDTLLLSRDLAVESVAPPALENSFVSEQGRKDSKRPIRANRKLPVRKQLEAAGLGRHAERLAALHSPAVSMRTKELRGPVPIGTSRIGGWPDLPEGSAWPTWNGRPMAFLAQINLDEAYRVVPTIRLPVSGLLSFFAACSDETWNDEPSSAPYYGLDVAGEPGDASRVTVRYLTDCTNLRSMRWTESPTPPIYPPMQLSFKESRLDWPDEYAPSITALDLDPDEAQAYAEFSFAARGPEPDHEVDQLMGYRFDGSERPEDRIDPAHAAELVPILDLGSESVAFRLESGPTRVFVERSRLAQADFSTAYLYYDNF